MSINTILPKEEGLLIPLTNANVISMRFPSKTRRSQYVKFYNRGLFGNDVTEEISINEKKEVTLPLKDYSHFSFSSNKTKVNYSLGLLVEEFTPDEVVHNLMINVIKDYHNILLSLSNIVYDTMNQIIIKKYGNDIEDERRRDLINVEANTFFDVKAINQIVRMFSEIQCSSNGVIIMSRKTPLLKQLSEKKIIEMSVKHTETISEILSVIKDQNIDLKLYDKFGVFNILSKEIILSSTFILNQVLMNQAIHLSLLEGETAVDKFTTLYAYLMEKYSSVDKDKD